MLDEAKAKSERHKSSWFAYKWFWQEVYLVAMLSLYRASLFNKSEMGWSFDDESTRASPDVYEKHDRIINIHVRLIWHVSNVQCGNWWFSITEKVFRIEVNVFDILFFIFPIKFCTAAQYKLKILESPESRCCWVKTGVILCKYADVDKCLQKY